MVKEKGKVVVKEGGGNAVYCLGMFGAVVYFVQQANGVGEFLVALLKAIVWPAFLIYELLKSVAA
jgi:hypothetical protein